jgi:hypothetical protein
MVVDAPHAPGQMISGDRVVAPSGLVPHRLTALVTDVGAFVRETYPLRPNANIGFGTPLPETETP